jgi:hypothetical protein
LKLRSNILLLLVVCVALLAAPAIVMALITDLGGNTSPTLQSDKADIAEPSANPHGNTSPATQGDGVDMANPSADTLPPQTIQSKEADYASGKTVTLTGSNWQPGESVRITVTQRLYSTIGLTRTATPLPTMRVSPGIRTAPMATLPTSSRTLIWRSRLRRRNRSRS